MEYAFAIWALGRRALTMFWGHWGPVIMMATRTILELVVALLLLVTGLLENWITMYHGLIYVLDRVIDFVEDMLELLE